MIREIRANKPSFNSVTFKEGLNVVLADRHKESTKKDSRNGLGKTTLVEIIHFCLGASVSPNRGLRVKALSGWRFSLELLIGEELFTVHRSVDDSGRIEVEGNLADLGMDTLRGHSLTITAKEWTTFLGKQMFGIAPPLDGKKYSPTFRSLIGYLIRRGPEAFTTPFEHHGKQREWEKQVGNAFLLGLSWENAQAWQELKDQQKILNTLSKAVTSGLVEGMIGSLGEFEAERVRLKELAEDQEKALRSFKVHEEYRQIEQQASDLTQRIHALNNDNVSDRRILNYYREALAEIDDSDVDNVEDLYEQVGVQLPGMVVRRLEDVQTFHRQLIGNRRVFLAGDVERIEAQIERRVKEVRQLSTERANLLVILEHHGALEEYTHLQQRHLSTLARVKDLEAKIQNLRKFEEGKSALKIDAEHLHQHARHDYDDRKLVRERAISIFNSHSQALYQAPGRLVIDIGEKGFKYDVEIERSGSHGIESMKIFCYDLTLAQLWAARKQSPRFLVHDSTIFAEVDERQVALAIERAAQVSREAGFQYICMLNSDTLPSEDFSNSFNIDQFIRLRLTDATPEGSLLGVRYTATEILPP